MPIDGVFLSHLTRELSAELTGARLDKINQPEASELRLQFRGASGNRKTSRRYRSGFIKDDGINLGQLFDKL